MCSSCGSKNYKIQNPVDGFRNRYIVQCAKCGNLYVKEIKDGEAKCQKEK